MISAAYRQRRLAWAGIVLFLAACGGGGGGGGGSSVDLSTAPGITVAPTSVSFAAVQNGALPPTKNVSISISAPNAFFVGLAVLGGPVPSWLNLSQGNLTTTNWTVAISTTSLPVGTYTSTIAVGIADRNQNILAYRVVQVSYTVQPLTGLAANPNGLTFNQVLGAPGPSSQTLAISEVGGASYAWNASVIYQSGNGWLTVNGGGSASGAALPTTLSIGIVPQVALGTLSATIRLTGNNNTLDVPVSYTLSEPQLMGSVPTLNFAALRLGPAPATQNVTLTTQSSLPLAYTTSVSYQGAGGWLTLPASGSAPGNLTFGVNTTTLAPGSYTANVVLNTASQAIPVSVTYVVSEPTLTRSPATLTFNAFSAGTPPPSQDVTLSTQQSVSLDYTTSVSYSAGATGWLSVTPAGGTAPRTATVSVNTTALAPATYSATVSFATTAQTVSVGVSYVVSPSALTFGPSAPGFIVDTTSVAAALGQDVAVGSTGIGLSWTAASSQPWLSVSPTSGSSGSSVSLSLVAAQLDTLDPGTHSATVTFSYTPPGQAPTTAPLSVSLDLRLPKVTSVNPYVATSGTSLEVIVRGSGFSNAGSTAVNFDATLGTSPNLVSDTEVRVTHPALTAGSYRVTVPNQLGNPGIVRSTASLVVVDAPTYIATTLAYPDLGAKQPLNIRYDAERRALLVGVGFPTAGGSGTVFRYTSSGSAWSATPASTAVSQLRDLALSPDGKVIIGVTDSLILQFDAATLAAGSSKDVGAQGVFLNKVAVANDGKAIINTAVSGSGFSQALAYSIAEGTTSPIGSLLSATSAASTDGSRVVVTQSDLQPTFQYNASTSTLSATSATGFTTTRPAVDRAATRILVGGPPIYFDSNNFVLGTGGVVYDGSYQKLGNIPGPNSAVALSPNGSKAYTFLKDTAVVHTYDLNGTLSPADPDTGLFPEIVIGGTPLPSNPGVNPVMTVSPDGGTLFIAGDAGIVVVPAP